MQRLSLILAILTCAAAVVAYNFVSESSGPTTQIDKRERTMQSEVVMFHRQTLDNGMISFVSVHVSGSLRRIDGDGHVRVISATTTVTAGEDMLARASALPVVDERSDQPITFEKRVSPHSDAPDFDEFCYQVVVRPSGAKSWGEVTSDEDILITAVAKE